MMDRHSEFLDDYMRYIQNALNRNAHKPPIDTLSPREIAPVVMNEAHEGVDEMYKQRNPKLYGVKKDDEAVKREGADIGVGGYMVWMYGKRGCP